jgi:tetratricopeptide (TPR) repeat protein
MNGVAQKQDLGNDFFKENEGHFWMMTETRPYMRAKACLAQTLWEMGSEAECIQHYWDCIRLNPNDNQGIRDPLFTCLLIKNDFDAIETLIKKYPEDFGASSSFNRALYLFKKHGPDSKRALKQIQKAIEFNRFVPPYLLKKRRLPLDTPDSYAYQSEEEAIIYGEESMRAWTETPEALLWLERAASLQ